MTLRRIFFYQLSLLPMLAVAAPPSEKVIDRYKQLLTANPTEGTAFDRLWQAYAEQGRTGALIAEFEQQPGFSAQMVLGLLLKKAGRTEDATQAFQRALTLDLKNPAPALALGRLAMSTGQAAQAAIWLTKAAELLPGSEAQKTAVLLELGAAYLAAGKLTEAAEAWEKTVALAPSDLSLRRQLADTYSRNRLGARAIPHLEFIVQRGQPQERAQALQQIAAIHQGQGDQDGAIRATERALAYTAPGNWLRGELQAQLIRLHQRYHRTSELESKWTKFAEENPRDRGAYLQLIDFYERIGERQQQLAWLEKLVQIAPKENEYRLRLARLLAEVDQLERAAALYDELLGPQPRNVELVFERARIDVQREQIQLAGERIAALLRRAGNDEAVRAKAFEFYQANRLRDLAEKHLREDLKLGTDESILALANFLFTNHREAEARETLNRLARSGDAPEKQAAAFFTIADHLKSQNELPQATDAVRKAIALRPDVRDYHFMLGELEGSAGHYAAAKAAFETAFSLSRTTAEVLDADQRLYDSLRSQRQAGEDEPRPGLPRPDSAASVTSAVAQAYLLKLQREAVEEPTEDRWLRVARWQQWSRNGRVAVDSAQRALSLNPKSLPAHDFLARYFAADPQTAGAQQHLRELVRLDPANRTAYLRRLGQVLMQTAQTDEALETFKRLVEEAPGDLDSLSELALAQQRLEQWQDALGTLQRIFELSPASRKRDAAGALLRVYERLAMREQAALLLLQLIDSEGENKERFALFQDLLALCTRHGLLEWLRVQFQGRRELRADDYFTEVALGRVLKSQGNKAAAFEVLSDAAFAAPNPAEALPELVREAEELRRLDAAVQLQAQLVRVVPQTGTEALERLAQLQEKNLQPEEAGKTWSRIVAKFPRDVPALERASEFERIWGTPDQSAELLRRIRGIEPNNFPVLARLAQIDIAERNSAEAIQCLEAILAATLPEKPNEVIRYPAVKPEDLSRLEIAYHSAVQRRSGVANPEAIRSLRDFWADKSQEPRSKDDLATRLEAIRNLAKVISAQGDAQAIRRWVERWQRPEHGPSERLWALHFVGASGPLLDELEKLIAGNGGDAATNAFIWLALETGEFARLGAWTRAKQRTPADRDFFMVALEHYLQDSHRVLPPRFVETLFPEGQRERLWQAANAFAQRGHFQKAAQLGDRVFKDLKASWAGYALELARWQVQTGDVDSARATLRKGLQGTAEGYTDPEYSALRAAYLLLPVGERSAFAAEILSGLDEQAQPVHTALVKSLLAGLAGKDKEALASLDGLLKLRPVSPAFEDERATAATRHWDFVLMAGTQLVAWQLDGLAAHLWQKALSDDAAISLQVQLPAPQGDALRIRIDQIRMRLTAIEMMRADPEEWGSILADYERHAPPDGVVPLAETLEAMGGNAVAVMIYRRIWEQEPANPHALRNALSACRGAGDWIQLEEILVRVVADGQFRQNDAAHRDLVQQLAEVLERRNDFDAARKTLQDIAESGPQDARLLLKLAQLQERCQQPAAAEATYRKLLSREPTNIAARVSLAALLDTNGKTTGAVDMLERASGAEVDSRLAELNLKAGRLEEALGALERVPAPGHARTAQSLADQLEAMGDTTKARHILRAALAKSPVDQTSFALQARLVRLLPTDTARAVVEREVVRLRQLAESSTSGTAEYFVVMAGESRRLGLEATFRAELRKAWDSGRGDLAAGVFMLSELQGNDLAQTWAKVLQHPSLDAASLRRAIGVFEKSGDEERRIEAIECLARVEAEEPRRLGEWARALVANNRKAEAVRVGQEVAARSIFNPELIVQAAEVFAAIEEPQRARELYSAAIAADPTVRAPELHLAYAHLLIGMGEFEPARAALQRCSSLNRSAPIVPAVVDYLKATGGLEAGLVGLGFDFSPERLLELRRAVFAELINGGKPAAALALAESFPQLLGEDQSRLLRKGVSATADFQRAAALLEQMRVQGGAEYLASELADLLAAWAESELASMQIDAALALLAKAHVLAVGKWPITEKLAGLYLDRAEPAKAAQVVKAFLSVSKEKGDRDKATQLLSRIPAQ